MHGAEEEGRRPEDVLREYSEFDGFPDIDSTMGPQAASVMLDDLHAPIVFKDMVSREKVGNLRNWREWSPALC